MCLCARGEGLSVSAPKHACARVCMCVFECVRVFVFVYACIYV